MPESKRLIYEEGKTSFDLQNSFNASASRLCEESEGLAAEFLSMFMPAWYWENK